MNLPYVLIAFYLIKQCKPFNMTDILDNMQVIMYTDVYENTREDEPKACKN